MRHIGTGWVLVERVAALGAVLGYLGIKRGKLTEWKSSLLLRIRPDHKSIIGGWFGNNSSSSYTSIRVSIRCAPSRALRETVALSRSEIETWVQAYWPDTFIEPHYATAELVRFHTTIDNDLNKELWLLIWNFGLVELSAPNVHSTTELGQAEVAIEAILEPITTFVEAINSRQFATLFPKSHFSRRQKDWTISLSSSLSNNEGSKLLGSLIFRGQSLAGKPSNMQISQSLSKNTARQLLSRPVHTTAQYLSKSFMNSVLKGSGYPDATIETVLAQIQELLDERSQLMSAQSMNLDQGTDEGLVGSMTCPKACYPESVN